MLNPDPPQLVEGNTVSLVGPGLAAAHPDSGPFRPALCFVVLAAWVTSPSRGGRRRATAEDATSPTAVHGVTPGHTPSAEAGHRPGLPQTGGDARTVSAVVGSTERLPDEGRGTCSRARDAGAAVTFAGEALGPVPGVQSALDNRPPLLPSLLVFSTDSGALHLHLPGPSPG